MLILDELLSGVTRRKAVRVRAVRAAANYWRVRAGMNHAKKHGTRVLVALSMAVVRDLAVIANLAAITKDGHPLRQSGPITFPDELFSSRDGASGSSRPRPVISQREIRATYLPLGNPAKVFMSLLTDTVARISRR
jgi:hypothetical protein